VGFYTVVRGYFLYANEGGCFLDIQKNSLCGLRVGSIQ
jgi:hypothetical protein